MTGPLIVQPDPEKYVTDWLYDLVDSGQMSELVGWSVGTLVKPGTTPVNAIRVRLVGGADEQVVAARPRLDVRVWKDGAYTSEAAVKLIARRLIARMQRDLRATVVLSPIPLPDPADSTKVHVMFTVEFLLRAVTD